jgi:hypothetical protein
MNADKHSCLETKNISLSVFICGIDFIYHAGLN